MNEEERKKAITELAKQMKETQRIQYQAWVNNDYRDIRVIETAKGGFKFVVEGAIT